jgi:hypothetical protein
MITQQKMPTPAEAKILAVRMFFQHGANATDIIRSRRDAARQAGDEAGEARWAAVLAAVDAAPVGADSPGFDAMLACWKRLGRGRTTALVT